MEQWGNIIYTKSCPLRDQKKENYFCWNDQYFFDNGISSTINLLLVSNVACEKQASVAEDRIRKWGGHTDSKENDEERPWTGATMEYGENFGSEILVIKNKNKKKRERERDQN